MLTPDQEARVSAALSLADANRLQAQGLVPGPVSKAWAYLIGASSSASSLSTNAAATQTLYDTLKVKAEFWRMSTDPVSDSEISGFESSAGATSNEASITTANQLSSSAFVDQVVKPTLNPTQWPNYLQWILTGAIAIGILFLFGPAFNVIAAYKRSEK
jgi:hypothetical protein